MGFKSDVWPKVAGVFVFVFSILVPKIAMADAGEGLAKQIGHFIFNMYKSSIFPYVYAVGKDMDFGYWGWIGSIAASSLTMLWMWLWKPKRKDLCNYIGLTFGRVAMPGLMLSAGVMIAFMAIGFFQGLFGGAITGAIMSLPGVGTILRVLGWEGGLSSLVTSIVTLVIIVGLVLAIWAAKREIIQKAFGAIIDGVKNAEESKGRAKFSYKITGMILACSLINRPEIYPADWSFPLYGAISIVSGGLGVYALIQVQGRNLVAGVKKPDIRETDGWWKCPVKADRWQTDKKGNPLPDPDNPGKFLVKELSCEGANGDGYNHPDSPQCGNPECAQMNPFYVRCPHCGHPEKKVTTKVGKKEGEAAESADADKPGFTWLRRRKRGEYHTCSQCGYSIPPPVEESSFYDPAHVLPTGPSLEGLLATGQTERAAKLQKAAAAPAAEPTPVEPQAPASEPAPVEPQAPTPAPAAESAPASAGALMAGDKQWEMETCPHCGETILAGMGLRICPQCGKHTSLIPLQMDPLEARGIQASRPPAAEEHEAEEEATSGDLQDYWMDNSF